MSDGSPCLWRPLPQSSRAPRDRSKHACCSYRGDVFVLGGRDSGCLRDFWKYSVVRNEWTELACAGDAAPEELEEHTMVAHKGFLYVFGGMMDSAFTSCRFPLWMFDIREQMWVNPHGRTGWVQTHTPSNRKGHSAVLMGSTMVVYGGLVDVRGSSEELWILHFDSMSWCLPGGSQRTSQGPGPRHSHSAAAFQSNMYVFGGLKGLQEQRDLWQWNNSAHLWTSVSTNSAPRDSCASCRVRTHAQPELVEAVKRHILSRLQMSARPNITRPLPKAAMVTALRRLHAGKLREDGRVEIPSLAGHAFSTEAHAETSEIISFAESDERTAPGLGLFFHISNEGHQNLLVTQAHLWLYLQLLPGGPEKGLRRKVTVKILYLEAGIPNGANRSPGGAGREAGHWVRVDKRIDLKRSGWHTFLLSEAVRAIFEKGNRRQDLQVHCEGCQAASVAPVLVDPDKPSHRPFLVVRAQQGDGRHRIRKRGLECDGDSGGLCCRQQFYIDFRIIGWNDWIIAPAGYYGNYCQGSCPAYMAGVPGSISSFHTAVVNQYRIRGMNTGSVSSCCIPTKLSTMSMLYFDDEYNIIKRDVPNMIVEECGCA
ncbi:inhibin beta B chain-like isoform X3 [Oryzias latipes]